MPKKLKLIFISTVCVLAIVMAWANFIGINKTVDKTVQVNIYEENDKYLYKIQNVVISGNFKKTLSSTSFVGTFAIEYNEPTCRDGVQAEIKWYADYQTINFYYAGNFTHFNIAEIYIDEKMENMMIILEDGTIITSTAYYIPTDIWNQYKG